MPAYQPGPYQQPTATPAARAFLTEVEEALAGALDDANQAQKKTSPTSYRDATKTPEIGTAPPVEQPGRPAMSKWAVDLNTTILTSSLFTAALGGSFTGILWASHKANPTVIGWICGCVVAVPVVLTIPVLAIKSLMKAAKDVVEAAPPVHNHHYSGDVYQDQSTTTIETRGIVAITRNELPPTR